MPASDDKDKDILIKAWEVVQALAKSNAESAWQIRAWGLSVWAALMAYGYSNDKSEIFVVAIVLLVVVFLMELSVRQIQYKFIERSLEIESCINSLLVGDGWCLPAKGISTEIDTPNLYDFFRLLIIKRWLIWMPYLLVLLATVIALAL